MGKERTGAEFSAKGGNEDVMQEDHLGLSLEQTAFNLRDYFLIGFNLITLTFSSHVVVPFTHFLFPSLAGFLLLHNFFFFLFHVASRFADMLFARDRSKTRYLFFFLLSSLFRPADVSLSFGPFSEPFSPRDQRKCATNFFLPVTEEEGKKSLTCFG